MAKIKEIIVEPEKVITGFTFKLKIKVVDYLTYNEVKQKDYDYYKNYTYTNLKGA